MVKIYKTYKCDELSEWDIERVKNALADADYFVYNYSNGGYDGSGFALWKKDGKYGYTQLSHCSCNGPVEDLNSIYYTLDQIKKLVEKEYYGDYAAKVFAKIKELEAKDATLMSTDSIIKDIKE